VLKKILRDNEIVNPILRNVVKTCYNISHSFDRLTSLYRIYGTTKLKVVGVDFKIYSQADDNIANNLFYGINYEQGEFLLIKHLVKVSNYFVDVGANTGIFSIYAARSKKDLKVLCFEPHPSNYQRLLNNISINKLTNIQTFPNAIGQEQRTIEFTVPADLSISTTASANEIFTRNFHRIEHIAIPVKQVSLDEILLQVPLTWRDVIKIDVEYYELDVLKGAEQTLRTKRPIVIIEILQYENLILQFPEMEEKLDKNHASLIFNFLLSLGYHGYAIEEEHIEYLESVESIKKKGNRNFIFIPKLLSNQQYSLNNPLPLMQEI
jgi:FkbM family methyltransferase